MSGAITIQIQDTGDWTLAELKSKIEDYVATLTKTETSKPASKFFGCIKLTEDPMELQRKMRSEW